MTTVRLLTGLSGRDYCRQRGDEHDCDEAEARRLIDAVFAVAIDPPPAPPVTPAAARETAVAAPAPERRGRSRVRTLIDKVTGAGATDA